MHISRTVLRVLEKKGFLLTTEGVSGMAAFLTGKLTQLRNGRLVVVFSESWLPSLLQLEQLINEGLAKGDRYTSVPTPVAGDVLIE